VNKYTHIMLHRRRIGHLLKKKTILLRQPAGTHRILWPLAGRWQCWWSGTSEIPSLRRSPARNIADAVPWTDVRHSHIRLHIVRRTAPAPAARRRRKRTVLHL